MTIETLQEYLNPIFFTIINKSFLIIILGIFILLTHSITFKFLLNKNTIFLSLMLPITVMFITQAISSNLYLSLGLIGALSIVRYRTPVKSVYELAYLFSLIAVGVIGGVNPAFAVLFALFITLIPFAFLIVAKFIPFLNTEELRFNSNNKIEMNIRIKISDQEKFSYDKKKSRLIRSDSNYETKECMMLINFNTMDDAQLFKNSLKFKPLSLSITNS